MRHIWGVSQAARELERSEGTVRNMDRALKPLRIGPKKTRYYDPVAVRQAKLQMQLDAVWKRTLFQPPVRPRITEVQDLVPRGPVSIIPSNGNGRDPRHEEGMG